jgi:hypothetical protein
MMSNTPAADSKPPQDHPPFRVTYCLKPLGTPGRGPPRGYKLQDVLEMLHDDYMFMRVSSYHLHRYQFC